MGCLPSKSFKGDGHRLGSGPSSPTAVTRSVNTSQPAPKRQPTVDTSPAPAGRVQDARSKAAEAALRRAGEAASRGTSNANPNKGNLSNQLSNQKKGSLPPENEVPERVIYD